MDASINTLSIDNITNLPNMTPFNIDYSMLGLSGSNMLILVLILFVIAMYLVLFLSSGTDQPNTASRFETLLIVLFIGLIVLNMFKYFFNIDIKASLVDIFSKEPELDIEINRLGSSLMATDGLLKTDGAGIDDEVFNISDNVYTYSDAKGICGAFGGRLANYFDIEKAYQKGGEWCSYGWSDDQMVFFPTQKSTYERLKKQGRQNECGRPGINGGFIGNPNARFGVNCVGKKPKITPEQQELMYDKYNVPQTAEEINEKKQVSYWAGQKVGMNVSPFNSNKWNM